MQIGGSPRWELASGGRELVWHREHLKWWESRASGPIITGSGEVPLVTHSSSQSAAGINKVVRLRGNVLLMLAHLWRRMASCHLLHVLKE